MTETVGPDVSTAAAVIVTVDSALLIVPSLTTSLATYTPVVSAVKRVLTAAEEDKEAKLFAGFAVSSHANVKASPLASELALPSRLTTLPVSTFCAAPAFATGAALAVLAVMLTAAALLLSLPSWTTTLAI